ncbi:uncharacterized protein HD556DRAFT_1439632 [Suillus plorans]|uniref:Uncharacterized protein n=1 Tax=Suillus plorans TaxID=116603 RepID=A0A9P7DNL8_9AGAM|nr:uncharacterized protein HD556DRAFT_1439632 [Suillus plorans]KAG1799221.1 hypothetical protein HD556DRAFT_1439632 [Suillus plorans]
MFVGPSKDLIAVVCVVDKTLFMNLRALGGDGVHSEAAGQTPETLSVGGAGFQPRWYNLKGFGKFGAGGIPRHPP